MGRTSLHAGEAMPGVHVLGTDLAGTPETDSGPAIRSLVARRLAEPVPLQVSGRTVEIPAAKLFLLDRQATVDAAMDAGRGSWGGRAESLFTPVTDGVEIAPRLVVRPNADERLVALLKPFARPPVDATVRMAGLTPVTAPARVGTEADLDSLLAGIEARVASGEGAVPVSFVPARPAIEDDAAAAAAEEAKLVVSAPVAVSWEGETVGTISPERLARLVTFEPRGDRLLVLLDRERLARVLDPAIAPHKQRARNAQFVVNGSAVSIAPSQTGTALDADNAVVSVLTAAHRTDDRTAPLALSAIEADLTTAEARGLGVTERISSFTTRWARRRRTGSTTCT